MSRMTALTGYSVSSGTMRPEDLISSFISELESLNHPGMKKLRKSADFLRRKLDCAQRNGAYGSQTLSHVLEEQSFFLDHLFDLLEEHAGPGLYFGSHPGDGADYGFWEVEDGF